MKISNASRSAAADAVTVRLDAGSGPGILQLRSGSPPTNVSDADAGTLLATLTLNDPAFAAAVSGVATANAVTPGSVVATAVVGHFRAKDSNGVTVLQGTVGESSSDLVLNETSLTSGGTVAVTAFTYTMPIGS